MNRTVVALALVAASLASFAQGNGLRLEPDTSKEAPWQARLEWAPAGHLALPTALPRPSMRLVGEYRLGRLRLGPQSLGSLSLAGGLLHGQRGAVVLPLAASRVEAMATAAGGGLRLSPTPEARTWSYVGLGYAASALDGAFGFRADLGVAAQNPGAVGPNRLSDFNGLDNLMRDLRLTPVLRLGMSYRF